MILAEEEDAGAKSSLIPLPYILILDTNIILDQVSKSYRSNTNIVLNIL